MIHGVHVLKREDEVSFEFKIFKLFKWWGDINELEGILQPACCSGMKTFEWHFAVMLWQGLMEKLPAYSGWTIQALGSSCQRGKANGDSISVRGHFIRFCKCPSSTKHDLGSLFLLQPFFKFLSNWHLKISFSLWSFQYSHTVQCMVVMWNVNIECVQKKFLELWGWPHHPTHELRTPEFVIFLYFH